METLQRTANRGSVSTGYDIDFSCKFEADNQEELLRTPSSAGNRQTWTVSMWFKFTELGINQMLFGSSDTYMYLGNDDKMYINYRGAGTNFFLATNRVFRDTAAFYHFVVVCDATNGTAADRGRFYVNGVRETDYQLNTYENMDSGDSTHWNNTVAQSIGGQNGSTTFQSCGYMAEVHSVDGSALTSDSFGEFDSDTGIWIPKAYSGSYGTNGFYLDFADASDLGDDESGNGNDFAETNLTAADQATDTPTNNFCTWSPLWAEPRANGTISEGATQVAWGGNAWKIARSSIAVSKGRWYWEIKGANVTGDTWNNNLFGFASTESDGQTGPSVLLGYSTGNYYYRVASSQTGQDNFGNAGGAWSSSDTFAIALDLESSTKKFILYRNGSAVNGTGTDLVSAFQTEQFFTAYATAYNGDTQFLNWGGYTVNTISSAASDANGYGTFEYAPPSGYYAICTKNLAEFG